VWCGVWRYGNTGTTIPYLKRREGHTARGGGMVLLLGVIPSKGT
jgi:hypothetical protein